MRQREQGEHRRADGDEHRPQPHDAGVEQRLAQRLALLVRLLDEVEEHDDVADDDADEADDAEERHEAERRAHEHEPATSAPTMPKGIAAKTMSGLIAFRNWSTQRQVDERHRDEHDDAELAEALRLLLVLAADLERSSRAAGSSANALDRRHARPSGPRTAAARVGNADTVMVRNWLRRDLLGRQLVVDVRDLARAAPAASPAIA